MTTDRSFAADTATDRPRVHRVMIASLCKLPGSAMDELLALRPWMVRFNEARGLRTAILHHAGWFLQWHEGSAEAVEQAVQRSETLTGHRHPRIVHSSEGAPALSQTLNIAALCNRDKATDVARRIYRIERDGSLGHALQPLEIWRWMAAPAPRHHVLAVTSEANESTDLVRSLADRYGAGVNYQRFAAGDRRAADAGAAFADLQIADTGLRLHALSRGALQNTLCRLSFPHMQSLVLMLGQRPAAAASLAESVVAMLEATALRPAVRLLGGSRETSRAARTGLARLPGLEIDVAPGMPSHSSACDRLRALMPSGGLDAANASVFTRQCIGRH